MSIVDEDAYKQLKELDDDDGDFSSSVIVDFFESTMQQMTELHIKIKARDYERAAEIAHFIKGGAAAIGAAQVRDTCDKLQYYKDRCRNTSMHPNYVNTLVSELDRQLIVAKTEYNRRMGVCV
jgi:HPt (histidine-containing phosphotransfer) domain-containing protein